MDQLPIYVVALAVTLIAVYTDLKRGEIHNWLTFPALAVGLALAAILQGGNGLVFALYGAGLGLVLFLAPFLLNMMGAGDVKLLIALGAFLGPYQIASTCLFSVLAGGVLGRTVFLRRLTQQTDGNIKPSMPFAPAILIGLILAIAISAH